MSHKKMQAYQSNIEEKSVSVGASFINGRQTTHNMEVGRSKPLLCVDDSAVSKKARKKLSASGKDFEIRRVTKSEKARLNPPVLFTVHGVFRGYDSIEAYAGSTLHEAAKSEPTPRAALI